MKTFDEIITSGELNVEQFEMFRREKIEERKRKSNKGLLIGGIIFCIGLIISIITYNGAFFIIGFVVGVITFFIVRGNTRGQFIKAFKAEFLTKLVKTIDQNLEYEPGKSISRENFKKSDFIKNYSRFSGEDYLFGLINNILFEFSEITIEVKRDKSYSTIFKGPFYIIDTPVEFNSRTSVVPDSLEKFLGGAGRFFQKLNFGKGDLMQFQNPEFEKEFAIYSGNANEAQQYLNENVINFLLDLKHQYKSVYFGFSEKKIYLGIDNRDDLFSVNFTSPIDNQILMKYYNELSLHLNLIERVFNLLIPSEEESNIAHPLLS